MYQIKLTDMTIILTRIAVNFALPKMIITSVYFALKTHFTVAMIFRSFEHDYYNFLVNPLTLGESLSPSY